MAEAVRAKVAPENPANQLKYVKMESKTLTSRKGTTHSSGTNEQNKFIIVIMLFVAYISIRYLYMAFIA